MARRKTESDYEELASDLGWQWVGKLPNSVVEDTHWICSGGHEIARSYKRAKERGCIYCNQHWLKEPLDYERLAKIHGLLPPPEPPPNTRAAAVWQTKDGKVIRTSFRNLRSRIFSVAHGKGIDEATIERLLRRSNHGTDRGKESQGGHA